MKNDEYGRMLACNLQSFEKNKGVMASAKVADLTVDELRGLIRDIVSKTLHDVFDDPDEGLALREEMAIGIQASMAEQASGAETRSAEDVAERLGKTC